MNMQINNREYYTSILKEKQLFFHAFFHAFVVCL